MNRVAVIADIHANLFALDAVLDDIDELGVDEIVVNGDLVGRGPQGSAVVERVMERGLRSSRGNHEDYTLSMRRAQVEREWLEAPQWACARWMAAELAAEHAAFLDSLPFTITSRVEPQLRLFHGSPQSYNEGIGPWSDAATIENHWRSIDETVLVVAHTHRAMRWSVANGLVVNVGSVGMPFNGDWRAQYAVFEGSGDEFEVSIRRVEYDREALLHYYRTSGFWDEGNAMARLLAIEIQTARSHLVPFVKWSEHRGTPPVLEHLDEFLSAYQPDTSIDPSSS